MSRERCWVCWSQLMYVKGKVTYAELVVDGVAHRVHKACLKQAQREQEDEQVNRMYYRRGLKQ